MYRAPLVYTVRRPFVAFGVAHERGTTLTNEEARELKLGLLLSAGLLTAVPDVHGRRAAAAVQPQPSYIVPGATPNSPLTTGSITVTEDPDPGDELRVILDASFAGPCAWDFGDGYTDYQNDNHTAHPYGAAGTYTVLVQSGTHTATTQVTVPLVAGKQGDDLDDMTVAETTEWVGDDLDRAQQALDAEQARSKPRSSLVSALNTILAAGQDAPA